MTVPDGLQGHALRRRAGRRPADRLHLRRPRPAVGRRVPAATRSGRTDGKGNDRVVIFEDTDGDGTHDKRTVFLDNGVNLSGIELGFGGVWLCSSPNLLFVPIRDGDDKPDGPPEVMLDGWNIKDTKHNIFNRSIWGPDGWLYGCNGIQSQVVGRHARHARRRSGRTLELRRLALSPDAQDVRGRRPRHDQPVGPRLRRLRRDVHHQLRDRPPLPRRPRRALRADVRPGRQPARLRPDEELRRPHPLGRRRLDRARVDGAAASPNTPTPAAATPTRAA